jgi:hypothetical protein
VPLSPPPRDAHGEVIPHDHPDIGSTDGVIRRIPEHWIMTESDGRRRLSSLTFSPSSGSNRGMSVDLQAQIEEAGLSCREFINTTTPQCIGAIRFEVGALREFNFMVGFNPQPSNPHQGEVWGNFTGAMQRQILPRLASWFLEIEGVFIVSSRS